MSKQSKRIGDNIFRSSGDTQPTEFNVHILHLCYNLIIMPSTSFEHPSVHPQEDLHMQLYGISFMHPYKQSGRWWDAYVDA